MLLIIARTAECFGDVQRANTVLSICALSQLCNGKARHVLAGFALAGCTNGARFLAGSLGRLICALQKRHLLPCIPLKISKNSARRTFAQDKSRSIGAGAHNAVAARRVRE